MQGEGFLKSNQNVLVITSFLDNAFLCYWTSLSQYLSGNRRIIAHPKYFSRLQQYISDTCFIKWRQWQADCIELVWMNSKWMTNNIFRAGKFLLALSLHNELGLFPWHSLRLLARIILASIFRSTGVEFYMKLSTMRRKSQKTQTYYLFKAK